MARLVILISVQKGKSPHSAAAFMLMRWKARQDAVEEAAQTERSLLESY